MSIKELASSVEDIESYNPAVSVFVSIYRGKTSVQIRADAAWQKAQAKRPKHLDEMTQAEKDAFKMMLDKKFPPHPAIMAKAVAAREIT